MSGRQRFTPDEVLAALTATNGLVYLAAEKLDCHADTICNYKKRYPKIARLVQQKRGRRVDVAEDQLDKAVKRGEAWAIQFILNTQGRDRGYVARHESEAVVEVRLVRDPNFYKNGERAAAARA